MTDQNGNRNRQAVEMIAGVIAIATLIVQDAPTLLHPLIGLVLLVYLLRDFRSPDCKYDRFLYSAVLALVSLLITGIFVKWGAEVLGQAHRWDDLLCVQWVLACAGVWFTKTNLEQTKGGVV